MTLKQRLRVVLIFSIFSFSGPFLSFDVSAEEGMVANQLVKDGVVFYNREDYDKAADAFSKALLAQPDHPEALKYLRAMGLEGGLYGYDRSLSAEVVRINQEIQQSQNEINTLKKEALDRQQEFSARRQELEQMIAEKEQQKQEILDDVAVFNEAVTEEMSEQAQVIDRLQSANTQQSQELDTLNKQLATAEKRAVEQDVVFQKQEGSISQLKNQLMDLDQTSRQEALEYSQRIASLEKNKQALEHEKFKMQDQYQEDVKTLEKTVMQKDAELTLKDYKLAYTEFDAASKEARLIEKDQKIRNLQKSYSELSQQGEELKRSIDQLKREQRFRKSLETSPHPKTILVDRIRKQDAQILELKDRLVEARERLRQMSSKDQANSQQIAQLNQEILNFEQDLQTKERELTVLKDDNSVLEARLQDAQENLKTVQEMLKEREEQLQDLEFKN